ncbi:MAG: YafY family transcriptional regulator [Candidatus Hydrogenedentes bacterium]|nr:YafY family transcriptional regulator [Candidatus Hydrogenedentota bacterium]
MRKAERLFQLVLLLRRPRVVTARELAVELQVSERTVYRDIQALVLSGVPIEGEAGVGYVLRRTFELPPLMFTPEEAQALLLGARMVQAWGDPKLEQAARLLLTKVSQVAPDHVKAALDDSRLLVPGFHVASALRETLGLIRRCIEGSEVLRFAYKRADGAKSTRTVRPLCLVYWGHGWTLGAWCELREDFRTFRLDRMAGIEPDGRHFMPEAGQNLENYLAATRE